MTCTPSLFPGDLFPMPSGDPILLGRGSDPATLQRHGLCSPGQRPALSGSGSALRLPTLGKRRDNGTCASSYPKHSALTTSPVKPSPQDKTTLARKTSGAPRTLVTYTDHRVTEHLRRRNVPHWSTSLFLRAYHWSVITKSCVLILHPCPPPLNFPTGAADRPVHGLQSSSRNVNPLAFPAFAIDHSSLKHENGNFQALSASIPIEAYTHQGCPQTRTEAQYPLGTSDSPY